MITSIWDMLKMRTYQIVSYFFLRFINRSEIWIYLFFFFFFRILMLVSVVQFCWFQMLWKNWVPRSVELFTCIYLLIKKRKKKRGFEMGLVWIFKVRKQYVRFLGNRRDREGLLLSALDRHRDRLWLCYCYQINIAVNIE